MPLTGIITKYIPELASHLKKGDCGRVGVIGGSFEYTGAPFFAAKASLITGADLVSVFCSPDAGIVLKGYCPELIVHPLLVDSKAEGSEVEECIEKVSRMLSRLDSIVVGPGLGRDSTTLFVVQEIIKNANELEIPMVLDADALYLLQKDLAKDKPEIVLGQNCVLTPNGNEFQRLIDAIEQDGSPDDACAIISKAFNGATVVQKGFNDLICTGDKATTCSTSGSLRRVGGQGDIMAGCVATFLAWGKIYARDPDNQPLGYPFSHLSAYAGSKLMRACAFEAFQKKGRAMITTDILDCLGNQFYEIYEKKV